MKRISIILGTIILGAIGSGLWEVLIGPFFKLCFEYGINLAISLSTIIEENIYSAISKTQGSPRNETFGLLTVILSIAIYTLFFDFKKSIHPQLIKPLGGTLIVVTFVYWIGILAMYDYIDDKKFDFLQLLTIVKPYIEDKEYDLIYSNFSQVRSYNEYNDIVTNLRKIASENNLVIDEG